MITADRDTDELSALRCRNGCGPDGVSNRVRDRRWLSAPESTCHIGGGICEAYLDGDDLDPRETQRKDDGDGRERDRQLSGRTPVLATKSFSRP